MQLAFLLILLFSSLAHADMRYVSQGMLIQDAVNASADGDTVLIQDGVYTETVVLYGKTLTIASEYLLDGDTSHVPMTAIFPDFFRPDTSSCFVYAYGERPASRLVGLTIEEGRGTRDLYWEYALVGGGVYLRADTFDVGLRVERCEIRNCHASGAGGMCAWGWVQPAQITLLDTRFYGCVSDMASAGGMAAGACSLVMRNCTFEACSSTAQIAGTGGAIWADGCELHLDSCHFLACVMGAGSAVEVNGYNTGSITHCLFEANANYGPGAIADLQVVVSRITIAGCRLLRNESGSPAVLLDGSQPYRFIGNLIENLDAYRVTGSLLLSAPRGEVAYNIIRNNTMVVGGAIYTIQNGSQPIQTRIHHNVITGNVSADSSRPSALQTAGMRAVLDSNWIAGNSGPTMDYYFAAGTAAIDARNNYWGHPSGPFHPSLNPGGQGDTLLSDSVLFIPWLTEPPDTTMPPDYLRVDERVEISRTWELAAVYPNPFNSLLVLLLAGFAGGDFEIGLYNLLGQQVDAVHRGELIGGQLHYQAPPWLASGVYLLSARDRHSVQTKKVVFMK